MPTPPGRDHATLALLPFTVAGDLRLEPLEESYQLPVDGRIRRFNVTIRPGGGLPLPTAGDQTVFLALLQLATRRGQEGDRLDFQRSELLDLLGWSDGGRNFDRLRETLQRLNGVQIIVHTALVSRDGREYHRTEQATGIVDAYQIQSKRGGRCWIEWGHIVREAFRLGDLKRLDWDLVKALDNPTTARLYRLLDRVVLSGDQTWEIGWKPLAQALGLSTNYSRPAEFRKVLDPHIDRLIEHQVIDSYDYKRGGKFTFHLRNYLRSELRRVLSQLGVYDEAGRQLVSGYDEVVVMCQCDALHHGAHPTPEKPGGWLTKAIREGFELRFPADEPEAFCALWGMLSERERETYHQATLKLCGLGDDLFATREDPAAWPQEVRSVARFLVSHSLDPGQV